jgi:hypothetical protein
VSKDLRLLSAVSGLPVNLTNVLGARMRFDVAALRKRRGGDNVGHTPEIVITVDVVADTEWER